MSTYYKYNFVSAEPLIALVKEEFKNYFDTGAIDDTLFPIYISKCLQKLGKGSYEIVPMVLKIEDYEARLPDDFFAVREAWLCTDVTKSYMLPGAIYQEVDTCTTRVDRPDTYCTACDECDIPDTIKAVYKTTQTAFAYYSKNYLLKPANIWSKGDCDAPCANFNSYGAESFDIQGNKFRVTFSSGSVYLLYYSKSYDCNGIMMIPDNFRIQEYIEAFLKSKCYEILANQVTDETFNQINAKAREYRQMADEALIIAFIETKKETVYDKHRKILKGRNRLNKYNLR